MFDEVFDLDYVKFDCLFYLGVWERWYCWVVSVMIKWFVNVCEEFFEWGVFLRGDIGVFFSRKIVDVVVCVFFVFVGLMVIFFVVKGMW